MNISEVIYNVLGKIVDTYPVLVDVEDSNKIKAPFAVYRIKGNGERTKENIKSKFDVGIFIVCESYEQAEELQEKISSAIENMRGAMYSVTAPAYEITFDTEDRRYVCEMNFIIKTM